MFDQPAAVSRIHEAAIRLFAERGVQDLSVSDLAQAAGVARGTIYNNIERPEALYQDVVSGLAHEMHARVSASMVAISDPARRLSTGIRMFVRRTHEEPHWGRFFVRFGANDETLRRMMDEPPAIDIANGVKTGRFDVRSSQVPSVVALVSAAALGAMHAVLSGRQVWRDAGSDAGELVLRALGVPSSEARAIVGTELPPLGNATPGTKSKSKGRASK